MDFRVGSVSDGWERRSRSRRISHGRTREKTEEDALATDEHGKTRNKTKSRNTEKK
jgi:hypothetical protein